MRSEISRKVDEFFSKERKPLHELFENEKMTQYKKGLEIEGLYAFWLKSSCMKTLSLLNYKVQLKGPKDMNAVGNHKYYECTWGWEYDEEWILLYVGKTTNFKNRLGMHFKLKTNSSDWPKSEDGTLSKPTTSCQLRSGIEHLINSNRRSSEIEVIEFMRENLWVSNHEIKDASQRFYAEDLAIGQGCPWFNLDSER